MIELTGNNVVLVGVVAVIGLAALVVAGILVREVLAASEGTERMKEIGAAVQEGAAAYLNRQFKTLSIFAVVVFFLLFLLPAETNTERIGRSIFFLVGAVFSGITGYMGMWLAVRGNVRVAAAAKDAGEQRAMRIAFRTGGVAGMFTVGLGLFGAALVVLVYAGEAPKVLEGFGFGAALLAMFMRVGGGIFTKAADVGADLVDEVVVVHPRRLVEVDELHRRRGLSRPLFESVRRDLQVVAARVRVEVLHVVGAVVRLHHATLVVDRPVLLPDPVEERRAHSDLAVLGVFGLQRVAAQAVEEADRRVHHRVLAAGAEAVDEVLKLHLILQVVPGDAARVCIVVLAELEVAGLHGRDKRVVSGQ